MRLLLVEDDILLGDGVFNGLKQDNYAVDWVKTGADALHALAIEHFDIVVLDLGLPDKDGLEVLAAIRQKKNSVPVLILTARDSLNDRIQGLDYGADDYLTKPFDLLELNARIRALIRRSHGRGNPVLNCGDLELDVASFTASYKTQPIDLTRKEYAILQTLVENQGKVVSRNKLEESLYAWNEEIESNALEVHIHHLRKKINKEFIHTIRGVGYIIKANFI